jgi:hypothetical protein
LFSAVTVVGRDKCKECTQLIDLGNKRVTIHRNELCNTSLYVRV